MLSVATMHALGFFQATPPPKPAPDAVVATIGGVPMTASEVEPYLWAWKSRDAIQELANHRMIAIEAAKRGIKLTDAEVQTRIEEQLARIKGQLQPGQTLDGVINGPLGGPSRLALIARSSLFIDKIAEADFKPDNFIKVATILFRTADSSTDALGKAIKQADVAYAALQAGKSWDDVLKANEKEPRIVATGGLVGWKSIEAFPEGQRATLSTVKAMGYSKPVQTSNGIQIFRVLARGATASAAEVNDLKGQYVAGSRQAVMERIRQSTKVEIK